MSNFFTQKNEERTKHRTKSLFLLAVTLVFSLSSSAMLVSASDKGTLLILGDSIATGHSLPDYDSSGNPKSEYSWATLLSKAYGAEQVNLAVDGDTTSDLLSVVQNTANRKAISEAKVICVSIGGNNFLQLMGRLIDEDKISLEGEVESAYLSMQAAAKNDLDGIFTVLRKINPHAEVLVQTMFEPYRYFTVPISQEKTVGDWMGSYVARYNTLLREKAEQYGHTVVDVAETFRVEGTQSWLYASMTEGTPEEAIVAIAQANPHPTREGHQGIFEAYRDTADSILSAAFVSDGDSENTTETAQQESIDSESTASDTFKAEEVDGCGSSIGVATSAMAVVAGMVTVFKRKKQD